MTWCRRGLFNPSVEYLLPFQHSEIIQLVFNCSPRSNVVNYVEVSLGKASVFFEDIGIRSDVR